MINDLEDGEIESDDNNVDVKDSQKCNSLDKSSVYTNRNRCYNDNNVDIIKSCSLNNFTSNSVALHGAVYNDRHHDHELFVSIINEKEMPKSNNSSQQVHDDSNCYRNYKKTDDGELTNETDETDDEMMICVRGASPVARKSKRLKYDIPLQYHNYDSDDDYPEIRRRKYRKKCYDDNDNDYDSCDSYRKSLEQHFKRRRKHHRRYSKNRTKRIITENSNPNNSNSSCIMKGDKPNSNDNENFNEKLNVRKVLNTETLLSSSKYNEDRKTEICKFYLTDCCIKSINCNYMHSEFPCKFYYLGMECMNKPKCKFMHGNALSEKMKTALLHHIIAAPKTILGNFKRLTYDEAESMLNKRDSELIAGKTKNEINFDLKSEQQSLDKEDLNETDYSKDKIDNVTKIGKISKSRWSPTLNDAENSISAEILKRYCSSKTDEVNCTKQEDTVLLKDSNLPSDIIENLAKHNITNLYQFSQLSLSLLEHLSSLKNKKKDDENDVEGKIESNNHECDKEHEKNATEPIENDDKHLLDDDEKENEQSENFELNSCIISDESDDNENLVIDESDIYNNEEPSQEDEICRDWKNDSTIKSSVEYKNEGSKFIEDEHYSDSDIIPVVIENGDVRVSPFIAIQEFSPAVEIMASINSHSPIKYKLKEIDICFKSKRNISLPTDTPSDEIADPRIKKMLNLKKLKCNDDKNENKINSIPGTTTTNATTASTATVVSGSVVKKEIKELDPRKRKEIKSKDTTQKSHQQQSQLQQQQQQQQQQKTTHLPKCEKPFDILTKYLQNSKWYQELNIVRRIYVNQQLVILGNALTEFHCRQSQFTDEHFSINKIHNGNNIDEILNRLQISIDPSGCIKDKYQNESQTSNDDVVLSSNDDDKQKIPSLLSLKFNESINSIVKNSSNINNTKNLFVQRTTTTTVLTPPNVHQQNVKRGLLGLAPGVPQQTFPLLTAGVGSTRGYQPPITYFLGNPYYSQSQSIRLQHPIAPPSVAPPVNYHPRYHNLSHHFTTH